MLGVKSTPYLRRVVTKSTLLGQIGWRPFSVDILTQYKQDVVDGKLKYDENQYKMLNLFQKLMLHIHSEGQQSFEKELTQQLVESNAINNKSKSPLPTGSIPRLRGVYLYGEVGTGKTMVMDIFHNAIQIKQKKRIHFHDFMLEVHRKIHQHKQLLLESKSKMTLFKNFFSKEKANEGIESDPIKYVAQEISKEARVLCFDEFQVTDICDAMILNKLFHELWERNTLLVATSNRPPQDLYKNGINREYFVPFINRLNSECIVKNMNIKVDYRQKMTIVKTCYLIPNNKDNYNILWDKFVADFLMHLTYDKEHPHPIADTSTESSNSVTVSVNVSSTTTATTEHKVSTIAGQSAKSKSAYSTVQSVTIPVMMGRTLTIPHAYLPNNHNHATPPISARGIAWIDFKTLCETEVGAADYIALCSFFHSVYIYGIPRLSVIGHNEARRFITLFDELYNANIRVQWTADAIPSEIFATLTAEEVKANIDMKGSSNWYKRNSASDDKASPKEVEKNGSTTTETTDGKGEKPVEVDSTMKKYSRNNDQPKVTMTTENENGNQEDMKVLESELTSIQDLRFAFKRAASRMNEMSSIEYYEKWKMKYHIKVEKKEDDI